MSAIASSPDPANEQATRRLVTGLVLSLLAHAVLLSLRFHVPEAGLAAVTQLMVRLAPASDAVPAPPVPDKVEAASVEALPAAVLPPPPVSGFTVVPPRPQPVAAPAVPKRASAKASRHAAKPVRRPKLVLKERVITQDINKESEFAVPQPVLDDLKADSLAVREGTEQGTGMAAGKVDAESAMGNDEQAKPVQSSLPVNAEARQDDAAIALAREEKARQEAAVEQELQRREAARVQAEQAQRMQEELVRQEAARAADEASRRQAALAAQADQQKRRLAEEETQRAAEEAQQRERALALQRRAEEDVRRQADIAAQAERQRVAEAQAQARQQVEDLARRKEQERLAQEQAAEQARQQAERLAQQQAAEQARQQAERLAQQQAAEQVRQQAERLAQQQAAEQARQQAERLAQQQAERLAQQQAAELARQQAERLAQQQAAEQARLQAQRLAEEQARADRERAASDALRQGTLAGKGSGTAGIGQDAIGGPDGAGKSAGGMPGANLGSRAREMLRGLDVLGAAPPPVARQADAEPVPRRRVSNGVERDVPLRLYVDSFRQKIERNGLLNGAQLSAGRVRIDPIVSVAIRSDGSVESVIIVRSSGHTDIDTAVRRIVRLNERFGVFPPNVAVQFDVIEIRRIWTFAEGLKLIEEVR